MVKRRSRKVSKRKKKVSKRRVSKKRSSKRRVSKKKRSRQRGGGDNATTNHVDEVTNGVGNKADLVKHKKDIIEKYLNTFTNKITSTDT